MKKVESNMKASLCKNERSPTMKKLLVLMTLGIAIMSTSSVAALPDDQATGSAQLHQINQSGIKAQISFLDTGSPLNQLVVNGTATGLDPAQTYVSLVYDTGAVPGGPHACEPSRVPSPLTSEQMFVGFWTVAADGTGTLFAIKTGSAYVPLSAVGAVSVRVVLGPPPAGFVLQACGRVHTNP
jgi:hypothetical protein